MPETRVLSDSAAVAEAAVDDAVAVLAAAVADHGSAVWVLAGGSSPMAAYRLLADAPGDLDWSRITLVIGDERMVPIDHADSNLGQILPVLAGAGTDKARTLLPDVGASPDDAARTYAEQLVALATAGVLRFDLVWLGVGEDGHTLSLFPGKPTLAETDRLVIGIQDSPKPPPERITLTLGAMDRADRLVVFFTGSGKRDALQRVRGGEQLPVALVSERAEAAGARVTWLIDPAADGSD